MTLDDVTCADMLKCSVSHLRRLARQGAIPATKIGRRWVFIEQDVVEWLRKKTAPKPVVQPRLQGRPRKRIV